MIYSRWISHCLLAGAFLFSSAANAFVCITAPVVGQNLKPSVLNAATCAAGTGVLMDTAAFAAYNTALTNVTALIASVNTLNTSVTSLTGQVATLNSTVAAQSVQISQLQAAVTALGAAAAVPFDYVMASAFWSFAFSFMIGLWYLAKNLGFILEAIKRW